MAPGSLISMIGNSAAPALGQAASVSRVDHVIAFLSHRGRQMFVPNDVVQQIDLSMAVSYAAARRSVERSRIGLPPGGLRGPPSSSHRASRMASMLTGAFSPSGARSAGHEAIADASEAQDARIARFSTNVRHGCATTSLGCSKTVPGCRSAWKSKTLCRGCRPHVFLRSKMIGTTAAHFGHGCRGTVTQATLASSLCRLSGVAPLMAICRGFMASGISRTSSILSRPLSNVAPLTWT
jgi:hypothetical protein